MFSNGKACKYVRHTFLQEWSTLHSKRPLSLIPENSWHCIHKYTWTVQKVKKIKILACKHHIRKRQTQSILETFCMVLPYYYAFVNKRL